jgi:hypothetical protein
MNRPCTGLTPCVPNWRAYRCEVEPNGFGTNRRNYVRITGTRASGLPSEDIGISIVSMASQACPNTSPGSNATEDSAAERTTKLIPTNTSAPRPTKNGANHPPADRPSHPWCSPVVVWWREKPEMLSSLGRRYWQAKCTLCLSSSSASVC